MRKYATHSRENKQDKLNSLFDRGDQQYERGEFRSAFRLFQAAAKQGNPSSQLNLGYLYKNGIGVAANRDLALYWLRRAYRQGSAPAAHNIGMILSDEQKTNQALKWFERAANNGDGDANLAIAKIYMSVKDDKVKAIYYLRQTLKADPNTVLGESKDEAKHLLKRLEKKESGGRTGLE
jgi:uncharacterized protein